MTVTFADLTTMRVGGPIGQLHVATTSEHAVELVRDVDRAGEPLVVMGGGSNLVVGDIGWDGTVVQMGSAKIEIRDELVTAAAGVEWDHLVKTVVAQDLAGVEALSGIPGSVGGPPCRMSAPMAL